MRETQIYTTGIESSTARAITIAQVLSLTRVAVATVAFALAATLAGCTAAQEAIPTSEPSSSSSVPVTPSATATPTPTPTATTLPAPSETPSPTATPAAFNKKAHSWKDPESIWVVSNKLRPLQPKNWAPDDIVTAPVKYQNPPRLRKAAADALVKMFAGSVKAGAGEMQVQSAYRSYDTQVSVYAGWVSRLGKAQADAQSARPGFSEHQTGLAVDISPVPISCALDACFGKTPQGKWLKANAWRYGYLLRYPADKVPVTGYTYEPWHFRYIGKSLSTQMHKEHVKTLEEFFGLPDAPDYKS